MRKTLMTLTFLFSQLAVALAQVTCPIIVEQALAVATEVCSDLGRNQACYGNVAIDATGRTSNFTFEQVGDIVDVASLDSLALSPLDETNSLWGIAMMRIQADIPDTLPGQAVTMVAFGNVEIQNVVPIPVSGRPTSNARMRSTPSSASDANVLVAVPAGTSLEFLGRNEAGDWLLAKHFSTNSQRYFTGWIATLVLTLDGDRMALPIVEDNAPIYTPLQAFVLRSGMGQSACQEAPPDGLLIQTPDGTDTISLMVNGVGIELGSTAFLATNSPDTLAIYLLEGVGYITANGETQIVPAGTYSEVVLTPDGTQAAGSPSAPHPYDTTELAYLPVGLQLLPERVNPALPPAAEELATILEAATASLVPKSGRWNITITNIITHADTLQASQGINGCFFHNSVGDNFTWIFDYNQDLRRIEFSSYNGGGVLNEEGAGQYRRFDSTSSRIIRFNSPTSLSSVSHENIEWVNNAGRSECETWLVGEWLGD